MVFRKSLNNFLLDIFLQNFLQPIPILPKSLIFHMMCPDLCFQLLKKIPKNPFLNQFLFLEINKFRSQINKMCL